MAGMNEPLGRKLRMGLVGGGGDAFIGRVHATAACLDQRAALVAGALSSDAQRSLEAAPGFGIAKDRAYPSYQAMLEGESQLPEDQRIDFVSIATPNFTHFDIACSALQSGLNVVCDKPMTITSAEAAQLAELVEQTGAVFALMHNYSGYPMVRQARDMVANGDLGNIQAVRVRYIQGWLRGVDPGKPPARGAWKSDPAKTGPAGSLGDVGTHAYQLARFVTGQRVRELACQLRTFAPQRSLDDYGVISLNFANDALGLITFSQVTHGTLNELTLEVDGDAGSLVWRQEDPNVLVVRRFGQPLASYQTNSRAAYMSSVASDSCRLPGGHPEGFLEAFANIYRSAFDDMVRRATREKPASKQTLYPNVHDGLEGIQFIESCLASSAAGGAVRPLGSQD